MKKRSSANKRPFKKRSAVKASANKVTKVAHGREVGPVIGRHRFEKISAVEGIILSKRMMARISDFERRGASPEERRTAIIRAYRKA